MPALKHRFQQTDTWTWAASSTIGQYLRGSGAITRINFRVDMTMSGTLVSNHAVMGLMNVINSIQIKGAGGVHYLSMGDENIGRMIHFLNKSDRLIPGTGHTGLTSSVQSMLFTLHFGSRPQDQFGRDNPFDLSAFIPAFDDSELRLEWGTGVDSVVDASETISSAIGYAEVFEVLGTGAEIREEAAKQGIRKYMLPVSSYKNNTHTATKSNLSDEHDVPTGAHLRRIVALVQDETTLPILKDDQVTRMALKLPVGANQTLIDTAFLNLVYSQGHAQSLPEADVGVTLGTLQTSQGMAILDLRPYADPDYGMNLIPHKVGEVKYGQTIGSYASGDSSLIWYDQVREFVFRK